MDNRSIISGIAVVAGAFIVGNAFYDCGKKAADQKVAELATKLAESEKTAEIKDGLYATSIVETTRLQGLLDGSRSEVAELAKQLDSTKAQLLTTQQVAIKWKNAYEAELSAHQTDGGSSTDPNGNPVVRKRVDFSGDLGPIHAEGHTLTDPAEAHLKLDQIRPLILTVAVAKNKDGKWQSYVTSSEPNMQVDVNLAGVNPGVISPKWNQRIWVDFGLDFLGGKAGRVGLSYHFDDWSLGTGCTVWQEGAGCGLTAGFRLFK